MATESVFKRKTTVSNPEDEAEYLDEQVLFLCPFSEQDKIINQLREKNEKSNKSITRGLAGLSALVSILYVLYIWEYFQPSQLLSMPVVPIPTNPPTESTTSFPLISGFSSITTLGLSFYYILTFKDLSAMTPSTETASSNILRASLGTGLVTVLLALRTSWVELLFWAMPLMVVMLYAGALKMMREVDNSVRELEKSKYNFKGA
ncbi:hypothetical protein BC938DRAFT_477545 [Jimgerdemannia flammicorona]|uniref:Transmembrane protein n=1 Tax=Jimgerdemannia flammicorona TaxID=994334 RepID=A0A433QP58_9FUNG|nr:hypothetical protein BC938DRAFT_477545 [Jimgerdemannia flammicorona]